MVRKLLILVMVLGATSAYAQTTIPGGDVSGTWTATGSPYNIEGEITVPVDCTLIIEPGVEVVFQGYYMLVVNGWLEAVGTVQDSILFTATNTTEGWHGLRFDNAPDSSHVSYCIFHYGHSYDPWPDPGGAIYCLQSNPEISHCTISLNSAYRGGGIACSIADPWIHHNVITDNQAEQAGGGIFVHYCDPIISNCTINQNSAVSYGSGIHFVISAASVKNCIISHNNGGSGLYFDETIDVDVQYSDFFDNIGGSFGGTVPDLLGQITTTNANGDSCDALYNVYSDPLFVDAANGDYHLQSLYGSYHGGAWSPDPHHSPCIDAGDPASPYSLEPLPNGDRINMGAYGNTAEASLSSSSGYPAMYIELTYLSGSPVGVGGGNIFFEVYLANQDSLALDFEAWLDITYEGGAPLTVVLRGFQNFPSGATVHREDMYFPVVPAYPAGNYLMIGRGGDFPGEIWTQSSFPFVKQGDDHQAEFVPFKPDVTFPDPFEIPDALAEPALPTEFAVSVHPNPFNPSTVFSYTLQVASKVDLAVYDIAGRQVKDLVDGWQEAGRHEVVFDGAGLASGVYIYRLTAGDFTGQGKMILLK